MATSDRPDPKFGISSQPLAILQLLADIEPTYAHFVNGRYKISVGTFPWYGGVVLQVVKDHDPSQALILTFAENSVSDDIEILHWLLPLKDVRPSGPTIDDKPQSPVRELFAFGDLGRAARHITNIMRDFYLEAP
jgi:hypothetical protein